MEKVILVDGNNLLFRSYYATLYTGGNMKTSKGFPTNALYGFVNMINKIVNEEKPQYIAVAFDVGKTFRHDNFADYKGTRNETPEDLSKQFPIAKEILTKMGIKYLEAPGYEADDIIGTLAKEVDLNGDFVATMISSDKDLLQLISNDVDIKLLKSTDFIRVNKDNMKEIYGIEPIRIIDIKALQGDASDNIPGVKGVGEKTALKLIEEYGSLESIYANIENIKGTIQTKLIADKENAFMSKALATIYKEVPLNIKFEDLRYTGPDTDSLMAIYHDLEFFSMLKEKKTKMCETKYSLITSEELNLTEDSAFYLETTGTNYHDTKVMGLAVYNSKESYFIPIDKLKKLEVNHLKYTYDHKKNIVCFNKHNINFNVDFDLMIAAYLTNYNVKDDIAYLANAMGYEIPFLEATYKKNKQLCDTEIYQIAIEKARFIYEQKDYFMNKIKEEDMLDLFLNIEMPLIEVLADMELTGVKIDKTILDDMGLQIKIKMELLEKDIFNNTGEEFNISSPKQLGEILFDKLNLPYAKKTKTGYSTDRDILDRLLNTHPVIPLIIEYRTLSKLYSTYVEGLTNYIKEDNRIHTIFNQTLTRTGRLSSVEPNLQNIPIRYEYGRLIRKCFIADENSVIMTSDYSQIELRILAHMSKVTELVDAFKQGIDIHTKTAMDIFKVTKEQVTKDLRRKAKAVNFGIIYGISGYGLSSNLDIDFKEAKQFIEDYLNTYPGVKTYMDKIIADTYETGYVRTLMNRKRVIEELKSNNKMVKNMGERMALNTPIQGSSADIIKKAMIEIFKEFKIKNLKSKMEIQVHDELVFNVLENELEEVKIIVKNIMENTYKLDVPIVVDIDYGNNWYEAK